MQKRGITTPSYSGYSISTKQPKYKEAKKNKSCMWSFQIDLHTHKLRHFGDRVIYCVKRNVFFFRYLKRSKEKTTKKVIYELNYHSICLLELVLAHKKTERERATTTKIATETKAASARFLALAETNFFSFPLCTKVSNNRIQSYLWIWMLFRSFIGLYSGYLHASQSSTWLWFRKKANSYSNCCA